MHAIRDIDEGEEITTCYEDLETFDERQWHLKEAYGFSCQCSVCTLPLEARLASDRRRSEIGLLDAGIYPDCYETEPLHCLWDCWVILQLAREEFGDHAPSMRRWYGDARKISVSHGDQARASVFASRQYKAVVIIQGQDDPDAMEAKRVMDDPSTDPSISRYGTGWASTREMIPENLDAAAFEFWLWRKGD